jgi:hypothetical protein
MRREPGAGKIGREGGRERDKNGWRELGRGREREGEREREREREVGEGEGEGGERCAKVLTDH